MLKIFCRWFGHHWRSIKPGIQQCNDCGERRYLLAGQFGGNTHWSKP